MLLSKLRYLVPSAITALALSCGVAAIICGLKGHVETGCWWIMTATILDRLDGFAARALRASSAFGMWLDSLSDFVAFGVAPAFLLFGLSPGETPLWVFFAMAVYIANCAYRLLNFSLGEKENQFSGVPSTLAGGVYAAVLCTALQENLVGLSASWPFALALAIFGLAMNQSWIRYGKIGGLNSRALNISLAVLLLACTVLILIRQLPHFVAGVSGMVMLIAPMLTGWDKRRQPVP